MVKINRVNAYSPFVRCLYHLVKFFGALIGDFIFLHIFSFHNLPIFLTTIQKWVIKSYFVRRELFC